jgi:rhamnosyl/mannosyltransferase
MTSVLQVTTYYDRVGGIETAVRELVNGLKQWCNVEVLCTKQGLASERTLVEGVKVDSIAAAVTVRKRPLALQMPLELRQRSADVVHYHLPFPLAIASHLLAPPSARATVVSWHADLIGYPRLKHMIEPFLQSFLSQTGAIIVSSRKMIEQSESLRRHSDKCHVVPYGVDPRPLEKFNHQRVAEIKSKLGGPLVLFTGRLVYYKGVEVLIQAMQKVNATLAIAGTGPFEPELRELTKKLGLENRVRFLGAVEGDYLTDLYHACDAFVLPSLSAAESFGIVQVEAMMCGKPVINTSVDSTVPEVSVHGETGLTVQPNNWAELSAAINLLLNDQKLGTRLGEEARQRALARYSQEQYAKSVVKVYEQVLEYEQKQLEQEFSLISVP